MSQITVSMMMMMMKSMNQNAIFQDAKYKRPNAAIIGQ